MPAPLAAPLQEDDVAAVGVDVHLLGVEAEDAQLHHVLLARTTTVEPTWTSVAGSSGARSATRPTSTASASSVVGGEACRSHLVELVGQRAARGDASGAGGGSTIVLRRRPASSGRLE